MPRIVRYHPLFEQDVIAAHNWYKDRSVIVASDFLNRVELAIEQIIANPNLRSAGEIDIRYWPLKRFPYIVFYDLTDTLILILGVMHTSQDANKWLMERQ